MFLFTSLLGVGGGSNAIVLPYPGSLLALDFVNDVYTVGETFYTASDVIDKPSFVTGGSLQLRYANETTRGTGVPNIIGDALAAIVPNPIGTFLLDWEELITNFTSIPLSIQDGAGSPTFSWENIVQWQRSDGGGGFGNYVYERGSSGGSVLRDVGDLGGLNALSSPGRRQVALTRTLAKLVGSADGQTAVDSTDGSIVYTMAADTASFGSFSGDWMYNEVNIRRLLFYPEVADVDLPALSAL